MANNCCLMPPPSSTMEGLAVINPSLKGEVGLDTAALTSLLNSIISRTSSDDSTRTSFFNALWHAFAKSTELSTYVASALSAHDQSDAFKQLVKLQVREVVFTDEFVATVANKVMDNDPFVASLAGKVVDKLINDEDTLAALKQCVISSLHRCDGTSLQPGDSVATCDEMQATIAGVHDDVRRALNR